MNESHSSLPRPSLPSLSVVLVSHRSRPDLERCLPTLYAQAYEGLEVIVVDNTPGAAQQRELAEWLERSYPQVKVVAAPDNAGYAGGNNLGLGAVSGELALILNPDTELRPGALGTLVDAVLAHPEALVTAKLLLPDGTINACGLQLHYTGVTSCRGLGQPWSAHVGLHSVPLVSGAAFVARTEILRELGGFADYFMYLEDAELSLRARLRGYEILCAGDAHITHRYAPKLTPQKFYYLERNRLLTLLRVYEAATLRRFAPALLLTELLTWAFALLKGPRFLAARARSYGWLWRERRVWRSARKTVQETRRVGDAQLLRESCAGLPFEQLVGSPPVARFLHRLADPLYLLVWQPRQGLR